MKFFLTIFIVICMIGCNGGNNDCDIIIEPPKWNPPQPIDNVLLGSWKSDWEHSDGSTIVTFYENNECIIKNQSNNYNNEETRNWYIKNDTLILPGSYDIRTMRFPEYKYKVENDTLFYVEFIDYPWVGCGPFTIEGPLAPLGAGLSYRPILEYKRIEDK